MTEPRRRRRGGRRASPRPVERRRRARHRALPDHRVPAGLGARRARLRAAHRRLQHRELDAEHRLRAAARRHPHRDARPAVRRALRTRRPRATDAINTVALVALAAITVIGFLAAPWIIDLYTLRLHGAGAGRAAGARDRPPALVHAADLLLRRHRARDRDARTRGDGFAAAAFAPGAQQRRRDRGAARPAADRAASRPRSRASSTTPRSSCCSGSARPPGSSRWPSCSCPRSGAPGSGSTGSGSGDTRPCASSPGSPGWTVGYVATNQVAFWVALFLAYGHIGDASVYLAAFTFFQLPHGLFAVSIMTALAPELAQPREPRRLRRAARAVRDGVPAHGARRDPRAPRSCSCSRARSSTRCSTTAASPLGTVPRRRRRWPGSRSASFSFSAYLFTLRGFYSMQDTRTPFLLNCLENGINIVLALALYPLFGVEGLAASWSIAYIVAMVVSLAGDAAAARAARGTPHRRHARAGARRHRRPRRAGLGRGDRHRLRHTGAGDPRRPWPRSWSAASASSPRSSSSTSGELAHAARRAPPPAAAAPVTTPCDHRVARRTGRDVVCV